MTVDSAYQNLIYYYYCN